MNRLSNRTRWMLIGGAGIVVAAVVLGAIGIVNGTSVGAAEAKAPAAESASAAVAVTVAPIKPRPIQRSVHVVGEFAGYEEVTVTAEVQGRVEKVFYDVGDIVRPGNVLLEIDPTDYELAVQELQSALQSELAKLGLDALPRSDSSINQLIESIPMAQRAMEQERNAKRRYDRAHQLYYEKNKTISEEVLQQAETEYEVARKTWLQTIIEGKAILAAARYRAAMLATAQDKLKDTKVLVPVSGQATRLLGDKVEYAVSRRRVDEGEMVKDSPNATAAVYDLVLDKVLKLFANVPERYISQVKVGQKVHARVESYPGRVFEGTISRISPTVDKVGRFFKVEILVPNPTRELMAGGFAEADILTRVDDKAWTVPLAAVVESVGTTKVFAVRDGKAYTVLVTTGVEGRDPDGESWIELVRPDPKELALDTKVITSGYNQLADGVPVVVRQMTGGAGPGAKSSSPAAPPSAKPAPSQPPAARESKP